VLRQTLFRLKWKKPATIVPWCTFTDPELARVGLSETEAGAQGIAHRVWRFAFDEIDRARADDETDGCAKLVTDPRGRILGAAIVGTHAGELIQPWQLAMANGLKIGALATLAAPYPTLGEASKRAAGSFYTPKLFTKRTRRLVRFLRWFG
jgi:pyruvate/2-oxoglutarate dehydrogenase complex dihydrolipoamide dehydrogenase (E3) component